MDCRIVAAGVLGGEVDDFVSCIDDWRRIEAASSESALIVDLDTSLQRIASYAEHREQEAIPYEADVSSHDTDTERSESAACSRDFDEPREDTDRPARELMLQQIRAMCADHREQEATAHTATVCSTAAARSQYTPQEHPGLETCSRDLDEPCKNTERTAWETFRRSSLEHVSNEETSAGRKELRRNLSYPALAVSWCTNIESVCIIPAREHESASLLWFDAAAVAAAAASGSRVDVKAAMEKSIRQYRNTW
jgi:hypothetical protein